MRAISIDDAVIARLPKPDGKPVPDFFGRRFLNRHELIATGIVRNAMTLRRLIDQHRFPAPIKLGKQIRLWDVLELAALVERLKSEREVTP
jgi:predicted DNA-binding transcriptional regulator AlpA